MAMYPPPPQAAGPPATGNASGPRAGFWRRFVGLFIDGILLGIVQAILRAILGVGAASGIYIVITIIYFTVMIGGARGQTVGQMAMGIRVIDFNTGGPIGYGRAFIRWLVSIVSAARVPPRVPLDALGQGEAVLARQGGERRRRAGAVLPRQLSSGPVAVQARVQPPAGEELVVRALLDHLSVLEHDDEVGVADRRQPVRDDERRPVGQEGP